MILVTGARGHFGNVAVQSLLKKGIPANQITALVRNEKKAGDLKNQGITVKTGNYDDYTSLEKAFKGVDKLLFISSNDPEHSLDQHKNVLNAAKMNNVRHIVYTGQETKNGKHTSIPFVISIHKATADLIINSGISYSILNDTLYADSIEKFIGENYLETGIFFPAGDGKIPFMPRDEMAEAAAAVLAGTGHENKTYSIAGETAYSFYEIAKFLSAIKGKEITYHKPDVNAFIDAVVKAGVPKELASFLGSFGDGMANGEFDTHKSDAERLLGRKPTDLYEFLKASFGKKHSSGGNMTFTDRNTSLKQTFVETNGVKLNVVEQGEGPAVLFVHGFPGGWRDWCRQMAAVAAAGYRAIALDTRGYGDTSKPEDPALYTILYHVGDLVGILANLKIKRAMLVGHDFGASVAWNAAMMRPDLFDAVFGVAVPPALPSAGPFMLEMLKAAGKEDAFYMFQHIKPEADEQWADAATTYPGALYWMSGLPEASEAWTPMDPSKTMQRPSPIGIPPFADKEDAEITLAGFQRDGFHGPLNIYRGLQPYFDQAKAFAGRKIEQPAFFVFGTADGMIKMRGLKEEDLAPSVPNLEGYLPIDGVGHWPQLEASDVVNDALVAFLNNTRAPA